MTKRKELIQADVEINLTKIVHTNRLFLDLLYNLSQYPHCKQAKHLVREGLFAFERDNIFNVPKIKK